jgi:ankyrin repeat protein
VDVNHKDKEGRNCLFYAILSNADNADVISLLLSNKVNINERDKNEYTPLLRACQQAVPMTLEVLLKEGADSNDRNPNTGDTGFHLLAQSKKKTAIECAKLLVRYGGVGNALNDSGKTPAEEAMKSNPELADFLLNDKADIKPLSVNETAGKDSSAKNFPIQKQRQKPAENLALGFPNEGQTELNAIVPLELIKEDPEIMQMKYQKYLQMNKEVYSITNK